MSLEDSMYLLFGTVFAVGYFGSKLIREARELKRAIRKSERKMREINSYLTLQGLIEKEMYK